MTAKVKRNGDEFDHRLLLYLKKLTGEPFYTISKVKQGIWSCWTEDDRKWIVKGFPSISRLDTQRLLTERLFQFQFFNTYRFHPIHSKKIIIFENKVLGIIEFIEKSNPSFSYRSHQNRQKAFDLIKTFHQTTSEFKDEFVPHLKKYHQINKWQSRLNEFKTNLPNIQILIPNVYVYLQTYLEWAQWSLERLIPSSDYFLQEPTCIIHGDVAHHNFYLGKNNTLYLIDFDLISIAPAKVDELQMANRILPYLTWSYEKLSQYKSISRYLNEETFLYALIYPTDILREWNRFMKMNHNRNQYVDYLADLTINQFNRRKAFVNAIGKKL